MATIAELEVMDDDHEIEEVARVLLEWNPLGDDAHKVKDLDGYRTEAIDIVVALEMRSSLRGAERIVRDVLNEAFYLSLDASDCVEAAKKITAILRTKA
jgi:hypothetical protein